MSENLAASTRNLHVTQEGLLTCECQNTDGQWVPSQIDLNNHIRNNNGEFGWGGSGFAPGSRNLQILSTWLVGDLRNTSGGWNPTKINLSVRIRNDGGELRYASDEEV